MTITIPDYGILKSTLEALRRMRAASLQRFEARLDASVRLNPEQMPANAVTMHSIFLIRELATGVRYSFTLVFPWEANPGHHRLSVLSPAGMALLGSLEGDVVACGRRERPVNFRVEEIFFQPESAMRARWGVCQERARPWK